MTTLTHMDKITANHAPSVRLRAELEYKMIAALISGLAVAGFALVGGNDGDNDLTFSTATEALEMAFSVDESTLHFKRAGAGARYWVFLVMGNDGYDVVSDYGCNKQFYSVFSEAVESSTADLVKRYS